LKKDKFKHIQANLDRIKADIGDVMHRYHEALVKCRTSTNFIQFDTAFAKGDRVKGKANEDCEKNSIFNEWINTKVECKDLFENCKLSPSSVQQLDI